MGILHIEQASRKGMRLMISLYGLSETGKTLSALKLAAGIEPDPAKRMLLDTEGGQRGRAYVDYIDGGYLYADLSPPFTPERYTEALTEIEQRGINVLVIDSISHAWFAEGGILDMIEEDASKNDFAKWKKPKRRLTKMTSRILHSDMHVILCSRAKQPYVEEIVDGRKKLVPGPIVPVQEKNLRYDMTVMALMLGDGKFTVTRPEGKCPGPLREVFAAGELMNEDMGRRLAAWIGAEGKTPEQRRLENDAAKAAAGGVEAFRVFWKELASEKRAALQHKLGNYQSIATAADEEREREREQDRREEADARQRESLDDPFGDAGGAQDAPADPDPLADWWSELETLKAEGDEQPTPTAYVNWAADMAKRIGALPPPVHAQWTAYHEARKAALKEQAR